jgi:hypothetical protein
MPHLGSAVLISREKTREGACAKGEAVVTVVIATKGFQLNMVPASKSLRLCSYQFKRCDGDQAAISLLD